MNKVPEWILSNRSGMELRAIAYGGIVVGLRVPDRAGRIEDVTLGFDTVAPYLGEHPYFGALIGRVANRIAEGRFSLDGETFRLARNNGPHHLHGGTRGFDRQVWEVERSHDPRGPSLLLRRRSPDGEEGYPGGLDVTVRYTITEDQAWIVEYRATTDRPTPVNLTQHAYFNLGGPGAKDVLDHVLQLNAGAFTPVTETLIPTGELRSVDETPFDFRKPTRIGERIEADDEQLRFARGYDHNFVLDRAGVAPGELVEAARVFDPSSGRELIVSTTEPGVQFYSGNYLDGRLAGRGGRAYGPRSGFCLETQHFPDAPNQPSFPSVILRPGEIYRSRTVFRFASTSTSRP